jgi:hypothetical protein
MASVTSIADISRSTFHERGRSSGMPGTLLVHGLTIVDVLDSRLDTPLHGRVRPHAPHTPYGEANQFCRLMSSKVRVGLPAVQ